MPSIPPLQGKEKVERWERRRENERGVREQENGWEEIGDKEPQGQETRREERGGKKEEEKREGGMKGKRWKGRVLMGGQRKDGKGKVQEETFCVLMQFQLGHFIQLCRKDP